MFNELPEGQTHYFEDGHKEHSCQQKHCNRQGYCTCPKSTVNFEIHQPKNKIYNSPQAKIDGEGICGELIPARHIGPGTATLCHNKRPCSEHPTPDTKAEEWEEEFPQGKESYCPRCYFEDEKTVLRKDCRHNWKNEFDKRFTPEWWKGFGTTDDIDKQGIEGIKSFIRSLLQKVREEERERILGLLPKEKYNKKIGWDWINGYNQALEEIKKIVRGG